MIGLFLLYFIGRAYYELAHEHERSRWGYAILGVVAYYGGTFAGGLILGIAMELGYLTSLTETSEMGLSFLMMPLGLLTCWLLYRYLSGQWSKKTALKNEALDQDLIH